MKIVSKICLILILVSVCINGMHAMSDATDLESQTASMMFGNQEYFKTFTSDVRKNADDDRVVLRNMRRIGIDAGYASRINEVGEKRSLYEQRLYCANEDRVSFIFSAKDRICGFGLYDGHGSYYGNPCGGELATKARVHLLSNISKKIVSCDSNDCVQEVVKAYKEFDEEPSESGCTAVTAIMKDGNLIIANVGDSRAVCGKFEDGALSVVRHTIDHVPSNPDEVARVQSEGGCITGGRLMIAPFGGSSMAMTRALGDYSQPQPYYSRDSDYEDNDFKPEKVKGLSATPDCFCLSGRECDVLVMGSDGFWDRCTNNQVLRDIAENQGKTAQELATMLIEKYHDAHDDTTVIVVLFNQRFNRAAVEAEDAE